MAHPVQEMARVAKGGKVGPPHLEDVSQKGPLRIPVPNMLHSLDDRDMIEADFRWYRWSTFAPVALLAALLLLLAAFALTLAEQAGSRAFPAQAVSEPSLDEEQADLLRAPWGVPRTLYNSSYPPDLVEKLPEGVANLRAVVVIVTLLTVGAVTTWYWIRPFDRLRTAVNTCLAAVLLFLAGATVYIGAVSATKISATERCPDGTMYAQCESLSGLQAFAVGSEVTLAFATAVSAVLLVYYSITGDWARPQIGWVMQDTDTRKMRRPHIIQGWLDKQSHLAHRQEVRRRVLGFALFLAVLAAIAVGGCAVAFRAAQPDGFGTRPYQDGSRGRNLYEEAGWSTRNTNLRLAWSVIGLITVGVNLLPFAHRVLAYLYAFLYLVVVALSLTSFGLDLHEVKQAHQLACPDDQDCTQSAFVWMVVLDMGIALWLLFYVLYEYIAKRCTESRWSGRNYCPHEIIHHDDRCDSMRPVRDQTTGQIMTAKEFIYRFRHLRAVQHPRPGLEDPIAMIPLELADQQLVPPPPITISRDAPHPQPVALAPPMPPGLHSNVPPAIAPPVLVMEPTVVQRTFWDPFAPDEATSSSQFFPGPDRYNDSAFNAPYPPTMSSAAWTPAGRRRPYDAASNSIQLPMDSSYIASLASDSIPYTNGASQMQSPNGRTTSRTTTR